MAVLDRIPVNIIDVPFEIALMNWEQDKSLDRERMRSFDGMDALLQRPIKTTQPSAPVDIDKCSP